MYIIGNNIYLARKAQGLTMQEVAGRTGYCRQTISDVESGDPGCALLVYLTVAEAVGVSVKSDILPQVFRRAPNRISILNRCRGTAKDGTEFIVKTVRGRDYIEFDYEGNRYAIPFWHTDPGPTSAGKFLYMFTAGVLVSRKIIQIRHESKVRAIKNGSDIHPEA